MSDEKRLYRAEFDLRASLLMMREEERDAAWKRIEQRIHSAPERGKECE